MILFYLLESRALKMFLCRVNTFAQRDENDHPNNSEIESDLELEGNDSGVRLVQMIPLKYHAAEVIGHRLVELVRARVVQHPSVLPVEQKRLGPTISVLLRDERVPV